MRSIGLPEMLVLFGVLFLVGFALILLVVALRGKHARSAQRSLIDRLPPDQLMDLLRTQHGDRLIEALGGFGATPGHAILTSVQRGIVVTVTGIGTLVVGFFIPQAPAVVPALGTILIFLGAGMLLAAFVSYRLSRRWRLLEENGGRSINDAR